MMSKDASIIILNWNGLGYTRKCIQSVRKMTSFRPFEVIVVDNGSRGEEVEQLKSMHAAKAIDKLILNSGNRGFSGGNNQGIVAAVGKYMILLNNDTVVTKGWLDSLIKVAEKDRKIGIAGPHIVLHYEPDKVFGAGYIDDSGTARFGYNTMEGEVEQVGGAAMLFSKSLVERIGGLDEGFNPIYFEESDFCARARRAGYKVVYTPKSKIIHFEGGAMKKQQSREQFVIINKNRLRYMLLHFPAKRLLKAAPFEFMRLGKSVAKLRVHWLLAAYWITLHNLPEILGKRGKYKKGDLKS